MVIWATPHRPLLFTWFVHAPCVRYVYIYWFTFKIELSLKNRKIYRENTKFCIQNTSDQILSLLTAFLFENIPSSGSQSGCHSGPSRYNNIASTVINGRIWFVSERRFDLVNSWYARCWRFEMVSRIPENWTRIVIVGTTVWISSSRWFWWCYFIVSDGSNSTTYWYIVIIHKIFWK